MIYSEESFDVVDGLIDPHDEFTKVWELNIGNNIPNVIPGWKGEVISPSNVLGSDFLLEVLSLDVGLLSGLVPLEIEAPG